MKLATMRPASPVVAPIPMPPETATIVNISESYFTAERSYGNYRIEGCPPGEPYVSAILAARPGIIERGDRIPGKFNNTEQFVIKAEDIAVDLVRQWSTDMWGIGSDTTGELDGEPVRGFSGVFVADGLTPTDAELQLAHELLAMSDAILTQRAHSEWDQFHSPLTIHAGWKRAARRLGVDAEWLYTVRNSLALPDCPHCGSKMKSMKATVCATCHRDVVPQELVANATERHEAGRSKQGARKAQQKTNEAA